jgi:hypothetical protein
MRENSVIEPMLEHLEKLRMFKNFNLTQLYFERVLPEFTLNADLWKLYVDICLK